MLRFLSTTIGICSLALAAGCSDAPKFKSTDITGVDYGSSFELPDTEGKLRRIADFKGSAVVLFFGYTHCPDVCPTTLADLENVMQQLGPEAERVKVLFVTVDPERDTPGSLESYVHAFDERFIGLRGNAEATQRVAKDFKIYFEKRKEGDSYSVDHSAQSYVFDPQGRLRLLVRPQEIRSALPDDLRTLLNENS